MALARRPTGAVACARFKRPRVQPGPVSRFHVQLDEGIDASRSLVVVGMPTLGLVGAIAAQHLVRTLAMRPAGRVVARDLPPVVRVRDGRSYPILELFVADAECKRGVACSRLLVLGAEVLPEDDLARTFAADLLAWAKAQHVPLVLVPDGMEHDETPEVRVVGVGNAPAARAFLDAVEVAPLAEGMLGGISAAFLDEGERVGVPVVALLGETNPEVPDARAAAAVLQVLARVLPGLPIDTAPLLADAEAIEKALREVMERAQRRPDEGGAAMFG